MAVVGALLSLMVAQANAADVFASIGADGAVRYSTQALDPSYRVVFQESRPQADTASQLTPRTKSQTDHLQPIIQRAANRHGVSPALVEAVISVESNRDASAISPKGAQGAMQLMPATAKRYGLADAKAWRDPERNIDAGVRHLKDLLTRHHGNVALALAAYNAGSASVDRHHERIPPYRETMLYVPAVLAKTAALTP